MLKVGEIAFGKYHILSLLGKGGMGSVYLAENINVGNKWAIKEIELSAAKPVGLAIEAEMLKKLNHPHLPRIVDVVKNSDSICIIEDYFEGQDLKKRINDRQLCSEANITRWGKQLAEILIYLHNLKPTPIIYSDLKPANIIIDTNSNLKLVDFGIAREYSGSSGQKAYGSPGYAAPEQHQGIYDERTDIFSFGATFYHALTGKRYNIDNPVSLEELNDHLSEGIVHIISKCLWTDPDLRYQTADELFKDLNFIERFNRDYKKSLLKKRLVMSGIIGMILLGCLSIKVGIDTWAATTVNLYQEKTEAGIRLTSLGQYDEAEAAFQASLYYQDIPEVYQNLARLYLRENKAAQALTFLEEEIDSGVIDEDAATAYLLGSAYFDLDDYDKAIAYFQQATGDSAIQDEDYELAMRDLAVSYSRLNRFDEAEAVLDKLEKLKGSTSSITSYVWGEIKLTQKDFPGSLRYFEKAQTEDPDNIEYILGLGRLYSDWSTAADLSADKLNRLVKAQEAVREGAQIDPYNIQILSNYGLYSYEIGQLYELSGDSASSSAYEEARIAFSKLEDIGMADANTMLNLAMVYEQLGDCQQAENAFQQSLQLDEGSSHSNFVYAMFKLKQKEYSTACKYLQKTIELNKNSYEVSAAQAKINELKEKGWL